MDLEPIDRRVAIEAEGRTKTLPLSQLRGYPYVVLLGEPGIGKSTALRQEALQEGGAVQTCREIMNGISIKNGETAYLDSLDEYRSGENSKDKLHRLANAIARSGVPRWRLTCRTEDWRSVADAVAMRNATSDMPITVATLLPLDRDEAQLILGRLGESNPRQFTNEAYTRGAGAFLESPLSLRLLRSAVLKDGKWPESRLDLFDRSINALAHEHSPERETDPRRPVSEIVEAAELMCFYLLTAGAKALWCSNALPHEFGGVDYVPIQSLLIDHELARDALDTALFRGEGPRFDAAHRTIAEFLAGKYLARKVVGGPNRVRLPLRRATALITSHDQRAPSELRGLYAWFAVHLSRLGDQTGAVRLIKRDAATVLAYGDAAAFSTDGRKAILWNLDSEDPYFLSSREGTTVLGGLAGDDLASDFITILDSDLNSHLQLTVLEALEEGQPVAEMQPKLHEIAIDARRPLWQRRRAANAWIEGSEDHGAARRRIYVELAASPITYDQIALRFDLLADTPTADLSVADLRQLLSDLNALPTPSGDNTEPVGLTTAIAMALKKKPRTDLFDNPVVVRAQDGGHLKPEIRHFLHQTLAAAIAWVPDLSADRLWRWIKHTRDHEWEQWEGELPKAIGAWIDGKCQDREVDLFHTLLNDSPVEEGPWMADHRYRHIAGRNPSEALIERLLEEAAHTEPEARRRRLIEVTAYAARNGPRWPNSKHRIFNVLKQEGGFSELIQSLKTDSQKDWMAKDKRRRKKEKTILEAERSRLVAELTPKLDALAAGSASEFSALSWAAHLYRNAEILKKADPLAEIQQFSDARITSAIAEGFVQFAVNATIDVTATDLGTAKAQNRNYHVEYVVTAGLHQALSKGREKELSGCPIVVAIMALRNHFSGDNQLDLATWAINHLGKDPVAGAGEVLEYWNAALDAGDTNLDALHYLLASGKREFASSTLAGLLRVRPNLPAHALNQALSGIIHLISREDILTHAKAALGSLLDPEGHRLWNFVYLALEPGNFENEDSAEDLREVLLAPDRELAMNLQALSPDPVLLDRLRIAALGKSHPAGERDWFSPESMSSVVRAAINRLSASRDPYAGRILKDLVSLVDASWKPHLEHAAAEHSRWLRDSLFRSPSIAQIRASLDSGPPANPADLAAIVLEEVDRYRQTIRTGSETPWKRYWNTDQNGAATKPQIENEDRDRLLEILRTRLEPYGIVASLPEARRGENTRTDILLISHAGTNLPIEAKRHYNNQLWTAPIEQLSGYTADEGAFGYGVYLVFWFGIEFATPARKDGKTQPCSAEALGAMLRDDLAPDLQSKISIIVLDVSRPTAMIAATAARDKGPRKNVVRAVVKPEAE